MKGKVADIHAIWFWAQTILLISKLEVDWLKIVTVKRAGFISMMYPYKFQILFFMAKHWDNWSITKCQFANALHRSLAWPKVEYFLILHNLFRLYFEECQRLLIFSSLFNLLSIVTPRKTRIPTEQKRLLYRSCSHWS